MRYFIGIRIDEKDLNEIIKIQNEIKKELISRGIRFTEVKKENIHLTIKFIGEYEDEEKLKKIVKTLSTDKIPNKIEINKIDNFNGRIIFLNVAQQEAFKNMNNEINKKLNHRDEKFHAHITLFRIKHNRIFYNRDIELKIKLKSVCLFNSTLTSQGPIYEILYEKFL